MSALIVAADANIPLIEEACRGLGEVRLFRSSDPHAIRRIVADADILLCRSTIRVDRTLLDASRVRFVATATSGFDHVDTAWLSSRGIVFRAAAGCNARSVAEYVWTALFHVAERRGFNLAGKTMGIVGVGHVGSRVASIAGSLGIRCVLNDPPLLERTGDARYRPLEEALACDIVTLHVPLVRGGTYPTEKLISKLTLPQLRDGVIFINTSRGGVVDQHALAGARCAAMILDVFEHEPDIDPAILSVADIATPHIAGHSLDGKLEGTRMVYEALCAFLAVPPEWHYRSHVSMLHALSTEVPSGAGYAGVNAMLKQVYDIGADDTAFRKSMLVDASRRGELFSALREQYPPRREYHTYRLKGPALSSDVASVLAALGVGGVTGLRLSGTVAG